METNNITNKSETNTNTNTNTDSDNKDKDKEKKEVNNNDKIKNDQAINLYNSEFVSSVSSDNFLNEKEYSKFRYVQIKNKHNKKKNKKNKKYLQQQIKNDYNEYQEEKDIQYFITTSGSESNLSNTNLNSSPIKLIKVASASNVHSSPSNIKKSSSFVSNDKDKIKEYKENIRKNSNMNLNLIEEIITGITGITGLSSKTNSKSNFFSILERDDENNINISTDKINDDFVVEGIDIDIEIENDSDDKNKKSNNYQYNKNNQNNQNNQNNLNNKKKNKKSNGSVSDESNLKSINDIKDLDKRITDLTDYNSIHTPFKMIGEELLNEEINIKYRPRSKAVPENEIIIRKLKESFKKMVYGDIKDKPNLSKILLDPELSEDVKLKILRKFIKYTTEDEVFSESADKIRLEINNLLKIKKIKASNDCDEIWNEIEKKQMPPILKSKLEEMYWRIITGEESKLTNLVNNIIRLPYHSVPNILDTISSPQVSREEQVEFIQSVYKTLDANLFGLSEVKDSIISYICQRINNPEVSSNKYLCLCGPAGVGKTSIVHAISSALKIPYSYLSLANIDVPSTLIGHDYTYEGSTYGCISDAMIRNGCANGILLFDELDKCKEKIHNTLLGIFDPIQNCKFRDAYFGNFPIDLSKSMMIICLNDLEKINPILRDRLHIINISGYSNEEKKTIVNKHIIPKLETQYKISVQIDKEVIDYIISNTSEHKGIRQIQMYLTKIYELVVLDKFTNKFNLDNKFKIKDISYLKIKDNLNKTINSMYI